MADDLQPAPATPRTRRRYPLAVSVAGALLVCCTILPWAGVDAKIGLLGSGVTTDVRGVDDTFGIYTLLAGLAAVACGLAGLLSHPRLAALAVVPGAVAVPAVLMFVTRGGGAQDRVSIDLGVLSVEQAIRFGWFAALACSLAVAVLGLLTLLRRA
ncbi:hypothetical protein [Nonomuraea sp. SYSU D8015]|uniref:hypothetical protein n=1 Tax=Nonomuraea sp. SYSU D8015 TaxID=2593644 RepID=UPI0016609F68|nr:hypothetical protein [Nonomuraea sp. SYSU D8015]